MVFKKHNWVQFGRSRDIVKMEVCDPTGRMKDSMQFNEDKGFTQVVRILKDSYGFKEVDEVKVENELEELRKFREHSWLD